MSLSSAKRFVIGMWPHGLTFHEKAIGAAASSYLGYPLNELDREPQWAAGLDAMRRWVADIAPKGSRIETVISDKFVRYLVLPWSNDLTRESEWQALARARISLIWSDGIDSEIQLDQLQFKKNRLVCAIDRSLTQALLALRISRTPVVASILPHFTARFNTIAADIRPGTTLLVAYEHERITVGAVDDGEWKHVRTLHGPTDATSVETMINRERLLLGLPAECNIVRCLPIDVLTPSSNSAV